MAIGRIPEPLAGVQESLFTTKGDLVVATGPSQVVRQGVGTNNQVLMADSVQADGVKWANEATATLTAKGDILTATGANTLARLAVGTNGHTLVADSSTSTGLKWAAPAGGSGLTLINYTTFTGSSGTNIDNILTDTYERYLVKVSVYGTSQNSTFSIRGRYSTTTHTGNDYKYAYNRVTTGGTTGSNTSTGTDAFYFPSAIQTTSTDVCVFDINFYRVSGSNKLYLSAGGYDYGNAAGWAGGAFLDNSQTWTGLNFFNTTGTMTGNAAIYGLAKS